VSVAGSLAMALDPVRFAAAAGFPALDDWQRQALRSTAPRQQWLVARQVGKSTTAGLMAAHQALYVPGSLVLCLAPTLRQSSLLFRKVLATYAAVGRPVDAEAESRLSLELQNGSQVVALPGTAETIVGWSSAALLLLDEAALFPDSLLESAFPMIAASRGRVVSLSSAYFARGWFYDLWQAHDTVPTWEKIKVTAPESSRFTPEILAEARRILGPTAYASHFLCEFVQASGSLFNLADVDAAIKEYDTWPIEQYLPAWISGSR
jgi:Terminase large subunit, T4likevirus-type, N-terminal